MAGATTPAKVDMGSIASRRTKGSSEAGCNLSSLGGQIFQLALLPRRLLKNMQRAFQGGGLPLGGCQDGLTWFEE